MGDVFFSELVEVDTSSRMSNTRLHEDSEFKKEFERLKKSYKSAIDLGVCGIRFEVSSMLTSGLRTRIHERICDVLRKSNVVFTGEFMVIQISIQHMKSRKR
jgi:hypothetical protein